MPRTRQRGGQPIGLVLQLAEGQVGAEERVARQVAALGRRAPQNLVERPPRVVRVVRDPVVVVVQPRPLAGSAIIGDRASAVDDDGLPGDVVRRIGGQEDGDAFELARVADPGNRAGRLDVRLGMDDRRIGQPRMEKSRRDGVDANVAASPRRRQLARQSHQARPCSRRSRRSARRSRTRGCRQSTRC